MFTIQKQPVSATQLNPKLDENHLYILRVDGRLNEANLDRDHKEPIILPRIGYLTELIIRVAHNKTLHGGNQLTLQRLRQQFWVIQGRNTVKSHIHTMHNLFQIPKPNCKSINAQFAQLPSQWITNHLRTPVQILQVTLKSKDSLGKTLRSQRLMSQSLSV